MSDEEFLRLLIDIITGKMRSPPIDDFHTNSATNEEDDGDDDFEDDDYYF